MTIRISLCVVITLSLLAPAFSATLHFAGTDSTTEVSSVFNNKALFLNLTEVAQKLTITVTRDTTAGIEVLSSPQNCILVFEQDDSSVQRKNGALFVRSDELAASIGCTAQIKKKNDMYLSCPTGLLYGRVGTQVGDLAPGFRLPVDTVTTIRSTELLKKRSLLVLFIRNGDWDPFSKLLLRIVQVNLDSVRALGYDVVAIHGYDARTAMKWKKDITVGFPLLADQYSAVIRAFDVFDTGHFPLPSVFAIDRSDTIRLRHVFDLNGPPDFAPILAQLRH